MWGATRTADDRSKSVGSSKTVALKLKLRIEAELETRKFDFLNQPENVLIDSSIEKFLEHPQRLHKPTTHLMKPVTLSRVCH